MISVDYIPADYDRIKVVESKEALLAAEFGERANVILYPRSQVEPLPDGFDRLAKRMIEYKFGTHKKRLFFNVLSRLRSSKPETDKSVSFQKGSSFDDMRDVIQTEGLKPCLDVLRGDLEFTGEDADRYSALKLLYNYQSSKNHEFHTDDTSQGYGRFMVCYTDDVTQWVKSDDVESMSSPACAVVRDGAEVFQFKPGDMWRQRGWMMPDYDREAFDKNAAGKCFFHKAQCSDTPRLILIGG